MESPRTIWTYVGSPRVIWGHFYSFRSISTRQRSSEPPIARFPYAKVRNAISVQRVWLCSIAWLTKGQRECISVNVQCDKIIPAPISWLSVVYRWWCIDWRRIKGYVWVIAVWCVWMMYVMGWVVQVMCTVDPVMCADQQLMTLWLMTDYCW